MDQINDFNEFFQKSEEPDLEKGKKKGKKGNKDLGNIAHPHKGKESGFAPRSRPGEGAPAHTPKKVPATDMSKSQMFPLAKGFSAVQYVNPDADAEMAAMLEKDGEITDPPARNLRAEAERADMAKEAAEGSEES